MPKKYGAVENYEKKLARVMERLGVEQYDYKFEVCDECASIIDKMISEEKNQMGIMESRARIWG